ncbi:MAG: SPW repeat protein [Nocardioidaceae bacterium]
MQKWTRWQDWVGLVVGVYAFLSPIWTNTTTRATWTVVVLGVITALVSLWALWMPGQVILEGALAALGVLFFISPWVMSFSGTKPISTTAWIVGVIAFIVGLWAIPQSNKVHHRLATTH